MKLIIPKCTLEKLTAEMEKLMLKGMNESKRAEKTTRIIKNGLDFIGYTPGSFLNFVLIIIILLFLVSCTNAAPNAITLVNVPQEESVVSIRHIRTFESFEPEVLPNIPKAFGMKAIVWKHVPYLFVNTGNGFIVYDISIPEQPIVVDNKTICCTDEACALTPYGDYDYNLYRFSICDYCRYGIAVFGPAGGVIFDLGTGDIPSISVCKVFGWSDGAYTYSGSPGTQMAMLRTSESQDESGLYEVNYCSEYYVTGLQWSVLDGDYPIRFTRLMYLRDSAMVLRALYGWQVAWSKNDVYDFAISGDYMITIGPNTSLLELGDTPVKRDGIDAAGNIVAFGYPYWITTKRGIQSASYGIVEDNELLVADSEYGADQAGDLKFMDVVFHPTNSEYLYVSKYLELQVHRFSIFSDGFQDGNLGRWSE